MTYEETIKKQMQELHSKVELVKKFPNLHEYKGRWQTFLCSSDVNQLATEFYIAKSCGCCQDAALYVRAYLEIDGQRIFADPVDIYVGNTVPDSTKYEICEHYESSIKHLSEPLKVKIRQFLKQNDYNNEYLQEEDYEL